MWFGVVSLFPEMFGAVTNCGVTRRACERGLISVNTYNPREFTYTRRIQTVDDKPYGGGRNANERTAAYVTPHCGGA